MKSRAKAHVTNKLILKVVATRTENTFLSISLVLKNKKVFGDEKKSFEYILKQECLRKDWIVLKQPRPGQSWSKINPEKVVFKKSLMHVELSLINNFTIER